MTKFGLIGNPITKSLSPALFKAGYNGKYRYDLIEGNIFEKSWIRFLEEYKGINVTAPFKEEAFNQAIALAKDGLGAVSGPCYKIRATNLLIKTEKGIEAYNSDFTGIILSVAETLFPGLVRQCYNIFGLKGYIKVHQFVKQNLLSQYKQQPQALIVGCGGAGRAAAVAAAEMGFSTVVMNRTPDKAKKLATELPEYGFIADPINDFRAALAECDLIIYTLPVKLQEVDNLGMTDYKGENNGLPKIILEANYKTPAFGGKNSERLEGSGCKYIPGIKWLLYQAITGYGILCGELPDIEAMEAVAGTAEQTF